MAIGKRIVASLVTFVDAHETVDLTKYISHLERAFGIAIAPDETPDLHTLGDMSLLVSRKLAAAGRAAAEEGTWETVRRITAEELGVRESDLTCDTRFVEDLCC